MSPTALLLLMACVHTPPDSDRTEPGRVGLRFASAPEGLIVIEVVPGMGAARAGLAVGDIITAIEGVSTGGQDEQDMRAGLQGHSGSSVNVTVQAPLRGELRQVAMVRGLQPVLPAVSRRSEVALDLQKALHRGSPRDAERAAGALVESGQSVAADAIGRTLVVASRERPAVALAAADVLATVARGDVALQAALGETYLRVGEPAKAVAQLQAVQRDRAPDVRLEEVAGDVGGAPAVRAQLADALNQLGRRDEALAVSGALLATRESSGLRQELSLGPAPVGALWRGQMLPLSGLDATLIDGQPWTIESTRGKVTVLAFWASWCAPCREELPHLQQVWDRRKPDGLEVLAVSVDDPKDREQAVATAHRLGLRFPVAHVPDWSDRFEISSLPSLRLIGRDGSIRYSSHGYSPAGISALEREIDAALAEPADVGTPIGLAMGPGELLGFLPSPGLLGLYASADALVLGQRGGAPLWVAPSSVPDAASWTALPDPDAAQADRATGGLVTWMDGPVAADPGRPWVRAWDAEGEQRWFLTTPGPVEDLTVSVGSLWVSTATELLRLDGQGALVGRLPLAHARVEAGQDGLWALSGGRRLWVGADLAITDRGPAPEAALLGAGGALATAVGSDLVVGRFGVDGGARAVVARTDGTVVGLDATGAPRFVLRLASEAPVHLAAWDPDGDGRDLLLLALEGRGLAVVKLDL